MSKKIVVFGAGKSATSLIDYLRETCGVNDWQLTVADSNLSAALSKTGDSPHVSAVAVNVEDSAGRRELVTAADIVISLLPPALHYLVAQDCIACKKNLLTASYVDDDIRQLQPAIEENQLLFLYEMGLDPGIDHMSAMQLVDHIKDQGGTITSFTSHCGGLVAPENDDNPWHYKISWNPRNVVLAGKAGAVYKNNGVVEHMHYRELFDAGRVVDIPGLGYLAWYPNRDSLNYMSLYGLETARTFIRTTLRYPEFCFGWKHIVDLQLTDETPAYETDGMSLQEFFKQHLDKHGFSDWLQQQLMNKFEQTKQLLLKLQQLMDAEEDAAPEERKAMQEFMMVDENGELEDINLDNVKTKAAATVAGQMHEANLALKQLFYLGMDDDTTLINKGRCSAAEVLQLALEKKLALHPNDKDMVVMLHEIIYHAGGRQFSLKSCLLVKGEDSLHTAMAKTVGLPLGIAAKLILQDKIKLTGLHIPIIPSIYEPLLNELGERGIAFGEKITVIP
jgi:saccharopine dehydrogenase-like NADP-dependent oxidoreductase